MKITKYLIIGLLFFCSCETDPIEIFDLSLRPDEITRIELRADHKTLLPNGVSRMGFHTTVYASRNVLNYPGRDSDGNALAEEVEAEFVVPTDLIPTGAVKIYNNKGNELTDGYYSTTSDAPGTEYTFYAKSGDVESNRLTVTIRELPDESYSEIVIPVIFHILQPPASNAPEYNLSKEFLEEELQRASDTFNGKISTDPNIGNAKVTFKLATYAQNGMKMDRPGVNIVTLSAANYKPISDATTAATIRTAYLNAIQGLKSTVIWDPNRYLNIWVGRFTTSYTATGANTAHAYLPPQCIHSDYVSTPIPGLTLKGVESFGLSDVDAALKAGILINLRSLTMPTSVMGATNEYRLAYSLALHYGLLETNFTYYSYLNSDGDNDYCPDTYYYYYGYYSQTQKGNNLSGWPAGKEIEYFTSFNVMDLYGYKNSISADQAKRLREVLKKCPDRWAYKSDWAFTGL